MDPLSAVSLAGNILQFVDTTKRLLSTARQISRAGAAEDILELESLTRDLRSWAQRVTPSEPQNAKQGVWSEQEESIRALGRQSREVADELLGALDKLKAKSQGQVFRPLESLYRALRAIWTQKDIDVLQTRLDKIGNGIQRQLATYDSAKILGRIESLDEHRRSDFALLASQIDGLVKDLSQKSGLDGSLDETARLLQKAAAQGSRYAVEQLIVKQLRFDAMDDRRETIALAHNSTYAWIFGTGDQAGPTSFNDWLTSDKTLYWVSGRPGSGKSTFMKYLTNHHQTEEHLKAWAEDSEPLRPGHFFWTAGEMLQKTQEGLLRSLLFQILHSRPELIPKAYPGIWRLYYPEESKATAVDDFSDCQASVPTIKVDMSIKSLASTLVRLCKELAKSGSKICFFIDGLDEHYGDPDDMIALIQKLRVLPNVKICVSSRPWNEFEQEFGRDSNNAHKLYMQELNKGDIRKYVSETFLSDPNYQDHEDQFTLGQVLVDEIVCDSNGVFLWVFLVVRSFQEGLRDGDSIARLREKLVTLPNDLNEYFERIIFDDVPDSYRALSADMFRVALGAIDRLPLFVYWFLGEPGAADPSQIILSDDVELLTPLTTDKLKRRLEGASKRLSACCKGLLEVQPQAIRHMPLVTTASQPSFSLEVLLDLKVDFLHRTVHDFLLTDDTQAILEKWRYPSPDSRSRSRSAGVYELICAAFLEEIRIVPADPRFWRRPDDFWRQQGTVWGLCEELITHLQKGMAEAAAAASSSSASTSFTGLYTTLEAVLKCAGTDFTLRDVKGGEEVESKLKGDSGGSSSSSSSTSISDTLADFGEPTRPPSNNNVPGGKKERTGGLWRGIWYKMRSILITKKQIMGTRK